MPTSVTDKQPLLDVRDLRVDMRGEHGWVTIVDGVNLTIHAGETVGLVGESGSGKTLTSLALMRLLPQNARLSGRISLDGRDLTSLSSREMNAVRATELAMVFQEPRRSLNPAFTVGHQVEEVLRAHRVASRREARRRTAELFDLVGIPSPAERIDHYPHEFSGGMCQRVMLAMAIACEPRMLIADEPTTALDVTVQREVLELILELQERLQLGVLLITHDLGIVGEVCDRGAVMYAGQVVEDAPIMEIFDRPAHPYTAGLLLSVPEALQRHQRLGGIPGLVPPPHLLPAGCRFHPRCPLADGPRCESEPTPVQTVGAGDHLVQCARAHEGLDLKGAFGG